MSRRSIVTVAGAIIVSEPRYCQCGCGQQLPESASSRRAFLNNTHRSRAFRKGRQIARQGITSHAKSIRTATAQAQIEQLGEAAAEGDPHALDDLRELEKSLDKVEAIIKKARNLR